MWCSLLSIWHDILLGIGKNESYVQLLGVKGVRKGIVLALLDSATNGQHETRVRSSSEQ